MQVLLYGQKDVHGRIWEVRLQIPVSSSSKAWQALQVHLHA